MDETHAPRASVWIFPASGSVFIAICNNIIAIRNTRQEKSAAAVNLAGISLELRCFIAL
jgi:hypothetical protein